MRSRALATTCWEGRRKVTATGKLRRNGNFQGVPLMQKEVVSAQVVSNWFANKRKELRRKTGGKKSADKGQSPNHHQCMSPSGNEVNENEVRKTPVRKELIEAILEQLQLNRHSSIHFLLRRPFFALPSYRHALDRIQTGASTTLLHPCEIPDYISDHTWVRSGVRTSGDLFFQGQFGGKKLCSIISIFFVLLWCDYSQSRL